MSKRDKLNYKSDPRDLYDKYYELQKKVNELSIEMAVLKVRVDSADPIVTRSKVLVLEARSEYTRKDNQNNGLKSSSVDLFFLTYILSFLAMIGIVLIVFLR